jgi:thiamine biosynthesis lipoprotein
MPPPTLNPISLEFRTDYWVGHFMAMGSPCELLVDTTDSALARELVTIARQEATRIEHKFSRYRSDNIVHRINHSNGAPVHVDDETARLLDYADQCHQLSGGKFDVTSGVLRAAWKFDGSDRVPEQASIDALLPRVGWNRVRWDRPTITLPAGMEIDLGGIGKEYAVDRTAQLLRARSAVSTVINFGGDLFVTGPRANGEAWRVGIDDPNAGGNQPLRQIQIARGGICTSGDARRFVLKDGVRYGHILNPETGWPVVGAPRSVTVAANTCIEAGMLATFAMLEGDNAEDFLGAQQVRHWIVR